MDLGLVMQKCREKAGLSQERLALLLNKSRSCISKIENGRKVLDAQTMMQWTEATGTREVFVSFVYGVDAPTIIQNVLSLVGAA
ncbi:helix-turn-helix domain-containing protein [Paenibacillus sp. 32352]|uniref:helix-turn-helix domain-containing protein n=1 Tax=Paenibacillus sp. 32352 TaxID=1969111 RepID=UPI002119611D|nr:helix-turn-helix transcriptional regulator [Paenibacillus sp. 32352]